MRSDAKNLARICEAIEIHDRRCGRPAVEIRMCPFEVERLGWDEVRGIPVVADEDLGSGRFLILCEHDLPARQVSESVEAVA